ncbi:MAG: hypothetical protein GY851_21510, partial [bacterium]|nr:hypothetical protein [bacterium]
MTDWNVFDANCMVGRHLKVDATAPHTVTDLLDDLNHHGIREALVLDCLSRENHPLDGNTRILEWTAEHPRLHPVWSALPPGTPDEQPEPATFLEQMRKQKVGVLFLFPGMYGFPLSDWCVDELLEPMADARVPLFVNYCIREREGWPPDDTDMNGAELTIPRFPTVLRFAGTQTEPVHDVHTVRPSI